MVDDAKAPEEDSTELVEETPKEPVVTSGIGAEVVQTGLAHIPQISSDMTIEDRRDGIRTALKEAVQLPDRLDIMAGELLYEVKENEYWKAWVIEDPDTGEKRPYASFDEYSETELGIKKRKAYYLCSVYEKFVVELGLDREVLKDLEWSKAKELVPVINADNWTELLDKLKSMTFNQVKEMVREMQGKTPKGDGDAGGKDDFKKLSFLLTDEQLENWNNAFGIAKTMTGSDKPGNCLDLICMDFVAGAADTGMEGALSKLDENIKHLERAFGVKLDIKEVDSERYAGLAEGDTSEETAAT